MTFQRIPHNSNRTMESHAIVSFSSSTLSHYLSPFLPLQRRKDCRNGVIIKKKVKNKDLKLESFKEYHESPVYYKSEALRNLDENKI